MVVEQDSLDKELHSSLPESNVHENSGRKWKDLQQDDDGRETVDNW